MNTPLFSSCKNVIPTTETYSLHDIIINIITGVYRNPVDEIRTCSCKKKRNKLKEKLPTFIPSLESCKTRKTKDLDRAFISANRIVLDFDELDVEKIKNIRTTARKDPSYIADFVSPSGNGLKIIIAVDGGGDNERHSDAWNAAIAWCKDYDFPNPDASGKDIGRLCYVSYDPDATYTNREPVLLKPIKAKSVTNKSSNTSPDTTIEYLRNALTFIPSDEYSIWIKVGHALKEYGQDAYCLFDEWSQKSEKYNPSECEETWKSFKPTRTNHRIIFYLAKKYRKSGRVNTNTQEPFDTNAMLLPSNFTTITESARRIFGVIAKEMDMFMFGGAIVELKEVNKQYSLSQISPGAFRSRIERYDRNVMAYVSSGNDKAIKNKLCSMDNAKALMESDPATELLPHIRIVTSCPILTFDLNTLAMGFHKKEGVLVTSGKQPIEVELKEAVEALKGLLVDNEFITENDRSRALSMMILPMMKMGGFISSPCPMDTAEANQSQSGKTYRQKIIAAIYNSSPLVVTQKNGGVGSIDESIASALATGRPFVLLDNFRGSFNSPMLEAIITTPECVSVRLPRASEQIIDASAVNFQLSSNGVDTTEDMANRSCIIRIRKQNNKKWKKWQEGDLLTHIKENQHYYLGCVITVIKSWVTDGKKKTETTDHDMREWAQTMDWIVQNIFMTPSLLDGHKDIQVQVSNPQLTWLRDVCIQSENDGKLGIDLLAHNIAELCEYADIEYPNKRTYSGEPAFKYIGIIMGKMFDKKNTLIVDNYQIIKSEKSIYNKKSKRIKLTKVYSIKTI